MMSEPWSEAEYEEHFGDDRPSPEVWVTRDGRSISIAGMDDAHLNNTIRFLRRRAPVMRLALLSRMGQYIDDGPYGAATACEMEASGVMDMSEDEFLAVFVPQWKALVAELARRKAKQ